MHDTQRADDVETTTVLVCDQQRLFSDVLASALDQQPDLTVLEERPATAGEIIDAAGDRNPDVALIDHWLDAAVVTQEILARRPRCKVIILSWIHRPEDVQKAVAAGVVGFLPKAVGLDKLIEAIHRAQQGESLVYAAELHNMVEDLARRRDQAEEFVARLDSLSPRELEILVLLSSGHLIQEIAKKFSVRETTVKSHISSMLKKTGARSHAEILAMARQAGIIQA